jgi:cell division protein FtsQ
VSRKNRRQARRNGTRFSKRFVRFAILAVFVLLSFYCFSQSPFFALAQINVQGNRALSAQVIADLAGVLQGTNLFDIDLKQVEKRLLTHPLIEKVDVRKNWPDKLTITVSEREPCALLLTSDCILVVDENGICLDKVRSLSSYRSYPIITGVNPLSLSPGERVSNDLVFLDVLDVLQDEACQDSLSEVNIADRNNIVAYSREGIPIFLGNTMDLPDKLNSALALIRSIAPSQKIAYVDVRVLEKPVVKEKNENLKN